VDGTDKPSSGRVVFVPGTDSNFDSVDIQRIYTSGKCDLTFAKADTPLIGLKGYFGEVPAGVGMGPDSIGVPVNNGVGCYRVSASNNANLRLTLGDTHGGNAFYALDIDMELKGTGAAFDLEVYRGSTLFRTYHLYAGAGTDTATKQYCNAGADSNADANVKDNCLWTIRGNGTEFLGDSFILRAVAAEGSLEAGGDFLDATSAYGHNTVIYLTEAIFGDFNCGESTPTLGGVGSAFECTATRVSTGATCPPIGYVLKRAPNDEGCELRLDKGAQTTTQFAGYVDVRFLAEPRKLLAGVKDPADTTTTTTTTSETPLTYVVFPNGTTTGKVFTPDRCRGTKTGTQEGNNLTITDVLSATTPSWVTDQVSTNSVIDWACIMEHDEDYIGKNSSGEEEMQIRQLIMLWGDPQLVRGQN
jgi:hypothetical protein